LCARVLCRPAARDTVSAKNCALVGIPSSMPFSLASRSMYFVEIGPSFHSSVEQRQPSFDCSVPKQLPFPQ
jgi:hypothetical protein